MDKLNTYVQRALKGEGIEKRELANVMFVKRTLSQMYASVELPSGPVKVGEKTMTVGELFEKGKEMGEALGSAFVGMDLIDIAGEASKQGGRS